jgi:hypothetical protein
MSSPEQTNRQTSAEERGGYFIAITGIYEYFTTL